MSNNTGNSNVTNNDDELLSIIEDIENGEDPDVAFGRQEVATAMTQMDSPNDSIESPPEATSTKKSSRSRDSTEKEYPEEKPMPIDPDITPADMLIYVKAEIERKGIAGHHIQSMDRFYDTAIKQIVKTVFDVSGKMKNQRDKTDEDREISDIAFKVEFTDVNLAPPVTKKYKSQSEQMLTPNMARIKNLTYSARMYISANISATATYAKTGKTKTRTAEIKDYEIASIPCFVGTKLCHLHNCSAETRKELEEDPKDPGGYCIIKGGEWCIDNLENITNNTFHVYKNMYNNEIVRGTFLSKPGDAFENSYQVILRYLNNGAITIEITTNKFNKFEIPFYLLFRALGMTRDKEIVEHIVYDLEADDPVTKHMLDILDKAFDVEDPKFGMIRRSTDPVEIIATIAAKITEGANTANARKDENIGKYLNNNFLGNVDRFIFPHIGTQPDSRIKKLRFLGHLINKLIRVEMRIMDDTDRDSYDKKRIHAAGVSLAKSFKTSFNFAIVQEIKKSLTKSFRDGQFNSVNLVDAVTGAIHPELLERYLTQAITTGNRTITMKRNEIANRVSSQTLYRKNDLNAKSTLNTVNTPSTSSSKQNERADEMRRVHNTYPGRIDVTQSADTGEKVGMTKQLACTASITDASSSYVLKEILEKDPDIIPLDDVTPAQIVREKLSKVFVNGDWVGCCRDSHKLVDKYRTARRHGDINPLTTVVWETLVREVSFWTDVGRVIRPLVIVYNNYTKYVEARRKGDTEFKFQQWIKLTKAHINGLKAKTLTMEDLQAERVIEYVAAEEEGNMYIASSIKELREHVGDVTQAYTHMDVEQAIFGIVSLASPLGNHSNAVRNTMYTNHRKQSAGWYALNWPFLINKNTTLQYYNERPIVSAFTDSLTYATGQNPIVAIALHTGQNQEDSVLMNSSSVDCGMFVGSHFNYEKAELDKGEQFGNPDQARTMEINNDAIYEYVENGFIKEGTIARKNYVLIVKTVKIPKPVDQYQYIDKSIIYKHDEPIFIEKVVTPRNDESALIAKVKYRSSRPIRVGDKVASRTGNKGIVAVKVCRSDMPYTENGIKPDLIVNAHSIPTRMAINQPIECLMAKLAVMKGGHIDATPFTDIDLDGMLAELESHGVKYGGHTRMYNGMTGDWIDVLIFIGPTTYNRLQKFVEDEHYSISSGPTSALTRQPLDGKNNDGGLRIGEMEKDVYCAHGTMQALFDKFYKDSDGVSIYICRNCQDRAIVNEKRNIYKCKNCGDLADIAEVKSSFVANLFFNEASAMNVKMKFELAKFTHTKMEQ